MTTTNDLTTEEMRRAVRIFESDVRCDCGADPADSATRRDLPWLIDLDNDKAPVLCPRCQ